ncbi:MAG: hypothetical protein M1825_002666 [Sarcosagium campestre]|nr:MAG: hypothetical protein M1825_002666 [Sarcosagium campestre]
MAYLQMSLFAYHAGTSRTETHVLPYRGRRAPTTYHLSKDPKNGEIVLHHRPTLQYEPRANLHVFPATLVIEPLNRNTVWLQSSFTAHVSPEMQPEFTAVQHGYEVRIMMQLRPNDMFRIEETDFSVTAELVMDVQVHSSPLWDTPVQVAPPRTGPSVLVSRSMTSREFQDSAREIASNVTQSGRVITPPVLVQYDEIVKDTPTKRDLKAATPGATASITDPEAFPSPQVRSDVPSRRDEDAAAASQRKSGAKAASSGIVQSSEPFEAASAPQSTPSQQPMTDRKRETESSPAEADVQTTAHGSAQAPQQKKQRRSATKPSGAIDAASAAPAPRGRGRGRGARSSAGEAKPTQIIFSNSSVPMTPHLVKFVKDHGITVTNGVPDDYTNPPAGPNGTVLCVGSGELKRTSKLVLAVARGRTIVTDLWVTESAKAGKFLPTSPYLPSDPERQAEWKITTLAAAVERGRGGVGSAVLAGWTVLFLPMLTKTVGPAIVKDLKRIASVAGAEEVQEGRPRDPPLAASRTLLIGDAADMQNNNNNNNNNASSNAELRTVLTLGWSVYAKEILSLSILRGSLDVDSDEFRLLLPA